MKAKNILLIAIFPWLKEKKLLKSSTDLNFPQIDIIKTYVP